MPDSAHLTWSEITEFKGLWNRDSVTCPPDYCTVMQDCYPVPGGGLRAFFAEIPYDQTNADSTRRKITGPRFDPVNQVIIGWFSNRGLTGITLNTTFIAIPRTGGTPVEYASNGAGPDSVFIDGALATVGTLNTPRSSVAYTYYLSGTTNKLIKSIQGSTGGLYDGGTRLSATFGKGYPVVSHQSRLVTVDSSSSNASTLVWTDPGTLTFSAGNTLPIFPQFADAQIVFLAPSEPGDLLVGKSDGTFYLVQGDLSDPIVREMARYRALGGTNIKWVKMSDGRIAFMADEYGVGVIDPSGSSVSDLSPTLDPTFDWGLPAQARDNPWTRGPHGCLAWIRPFLIAPYGHIWDSRTNAWFHCTSLKDIALFNEIYDFANTAATYASQLAGLPSVEGTRWMDSYYGTTPDPVLGQTYTRVFIAEEHDVKQWYAGAAFDALNSVFVRRASSYTFTTAPFRAPAGRQLELREVRLIVRPESSLGTKTVTVTLSTGQTQSITIPPGNNDRQILPFFFRERAPEILITVTCSTDAVALGSTTSGAAPMIEAMGVGWQPGHALRNTSIAPNSYDGYWKLGIAGRSELDSTAVLG